MTNKGSEISFDFGANWIEFATKMLTFERVERARREFVGLIGIVGTRRGTFLDVGYGQGLAVLLAAEMGFCVTGVDIDKKNLVAFRHVRKKFFPTVDRSINLISGSILDEALVRTLQLQEPDGFDVVHAWGVLHHTGHLSRALDNTLRLSSPTGRIILAIYARHWSSPIWWGVKKTYCWAPVWVRRLIELVFLPILGLRLALSPELRAGAGSRGMSLVSDLRDWLGGYPYEYLSVSEVCDWAERNMLKPVFIRKAAGWTGCTEYVFERDGPRANVGR